MGEYEVASKSFHNLGNLRTLLGRPPGGPGLGDGGGGARGSSGSSDISSEDGPA